MGHSTAGSPSKHGPGSTGNRPKDMPVAEFRAALHDLGFAWLKNAGRFIDERHRGAHRFMVPVADGRGRIARRETLAALKSWRAGHEAGLRAKAELQERQLALAAAIAPRALPPCRADLRDAEAVAQLADDFLIASAASEGVSFKSLINKGWCAEQLRRHGDAARALADRRQVVEAL